MSRTRPALTESTSVMPEVLSAVVERLARLAPDVPEDRLREEAVSLLSAALGAVPSPEVQRERAEAAAAAAATAAEEVLPEEERWRSRTLRVALTVLDVLEGAGTDSSAVLSASAGEFGDALEVLLRGTRDALSEHFDVDAFSPATWPASVVEEVLASSRDWVTHYRNVNAVVPGWSLPEPTSEALWDSPGWEDRYREVVPALLSQVLHPVEFDEEEWEEFLYGELEYLEAAQEELLGRVTEADLVAAGVSRTEDGRFSGLPLSPVEE